MILKTYSPFLTGEELSCRELLGMKNKDIHTSQISQSESYLDGIGYGSRLDRASGEWYPTDPLEDNWLQVDLLRQTIITGLITQGSSDLDHYLTGYKVITSLDGFNWDNVTDADGEFEVGLPYCQLIYMFVSIRGSNFPSVEFLKPSTYMSLTDIYL